MKKTVTVKKKSASPKIKILNKRNIVIAASVVALGIGGLFVQNRVVNQDSADAAGWTLMKTIYNQYPYGYGVRVCKGAFNSTTRARTYRVLITSEFAGTLSYSGPISGSVVSYGSASTSFTSSTSKNLTVKSGIVTSTFAINESTVWNSCF